MFEENGILVMQNGIVKLNTNRKLSLDEFRGFLYDEYAPLIFSTVMIAMQGRYLL